MENKEGNRVVQVVVAGVSPPMPGIQTCHISSPTSNGDVVVVRIPRATVPAMVHLQNRSEFWVRRDRQKISMTHAEIIERVRIGLRDERDVDEFISKRIEEFSRQRVKGLSLFLAVTPTTPAGTVRVPIRDSRIYSILKDERDTKTSLVWGVSAHPSLDGLEGRVGEDYIFEIHHRGHVEIVHYNAGDNIRSRVPVPQGNPALEGYFLATSIVVIVRRAHQVYEASGSFEPYVITLQMNNTQNTMMPRGEGDFGTAYRRIILKVQAIGYYDDENDLPAKRVCDRLWQAYGYADCPFFDANHNFMPRR